MENSIKINLKGFKVMLLKILNLLHDLGFVAEDKEKWCAVVNRVMNCPVHKVIGIY
jgi:hypothetical protein